MTVVDVDNTFCHFEDLVDPYEFSLRFCGRFLIYNNDRLWKRQADTFVVKDGKFRRMFLINFSAQLFGKALVLISKRGPYR